MENGMQAMDRVSDKHCDWPVTRDLGREARRARAGARVSVARLNALAARVESEIDAILRGVTHAVPH
jgi:hypothetical protein